MSEIWQRRAKFYAALRSDRFRQGTAHLRQFTIDGHEEMCCLEVAAVVAEEDGLELHYRETTELRYYLDDMCESGEIVGEHEHDDGCYSNDVLMPRKVQEYYGFPDADPDLLTGEHVGDEEIRQSASTLNDELAWNFAQIADAFEATYPSEPEAPSGVLEP